MDMTVDFTKGNQNFSLGFAALRWPDGDPDKTKCSFWKNDEELAALIWVFFKQVIDDEIEKRYKKSNSKWRAKAFKEEFVLEDIKRMFNDAVVLATKFLKGTIKTTPNIEMIPGRDIEV